jgi:hypothetical protein
MDHQAFAQLLGNYGEFFGSIAVFLTLIYLAVQVRQTSKLLRATIREQRTASAMKLQLVLAERTGDVSDYMNAVFRDWDTYTRQHRDGLIDASEWRTQKVIWAHLLRDQGIRDLWETHGGAYSHELQEVIQRFLKD